MGILEKDPGIGANRNKSTCQCALNLSGMRAGRLLEISDQLVTSALLFKELALELLVLLQTDFMHAYEQSKHGHKHESHDRAEAEKGGHL